MRRQLREATHVLLVYHGQHPLLLNENSTNADLVEREDSLDLAAAAPPSLPHLQRHDSEYPSEKPSNKGAPI